MCNSIDLFPLLLTIKTVTLTTEKLQHIKKCFIEIGRMFYDLMTQFSFNHSSS